MARKISFLGIVVGDQSCDLIGKLWSYGFDSAVPTTDPLSPRMASRVAGARSVALVAVGPVAAGSLFLLTRNRAWTLGVGSAPPPMP